MRLRRTALCLAIACAITLSAGAAADAQDESASEKATIEKLKNAVEQRDTVIRDLLRRVDKLERSERDRRVANGKSPNSPAARGASKPAILPLDKSDELESVVGGAIAPGDIPARSNQPAIAQASPPSTPPRNAPPAASSPPAGPGQFEVSPEAAERALERALVQTGASLLPPWTVEVVPSLTYQYREVSRPGTIALSYQRQRDRDRRDSPNLNLPGRDAGKSWIALGLSDRSGNTSLRIQEPYDHHPSSWVCSQFEFD